MILLSKAIIYLKNKNIIDFIFITHANNEGANIICLKLQGELKQTIQELEFNNRLSCSNNTNIKIDLVTIEDISTLIDIDHQCFPILNKEDLKKRYDNSMQNQNRQVYVARTQDNIIIGKLHIRKDRSQTIMHEVAISPIFQRKGFCRIFLTQWLTQFHSHNSSPIIVEVLCDNEAALALYHSCGFTKRNTYNYYLISLFNLYNINFY